MSKKAQIVQRHARFWLAAALALAARRVPTSTYRAGVLASLQARQQGGGKPNANAEAANIERFTAIDARITVIDARLKAEFPDYAALALSSVSTRQNGSRHPRRRSFGS